MIIVRYSEIGVKGKNRGLFEQRLVHNITQFLFSHKIVYDRIQRIQGRILIQTTDSCIGLQNVFGIKSFSVAHETTHKLEDIQECISQYFLVHMQNNFAVRCQRLNKDLPFTSADVEKKIGSFIVEKTGYSVQLTNPESVLFIELIQKKAYVFNSKTAGFGGLPIGIAGRVLLVGSDTNAFLAGWMMMKRGATLIIENQPLRVALQKWSYGDVIPRHLGEEIAIVNGATLENSNPQIYEQVVFSPLIGMSQDEIETWHNKLVNLSYP